MKTTRIFGLIACVVLLGGWAYAQEETTSEPSVVTVRQTLDYTYNNWLGGPWFVEPGWILDHSPFYRLPTEDWGWTHNMTSLTPANATGIESATLTIIAWNVDDNSPQAADHVIIAGGTYQNDEDFGTYQGGGTELGVLSTYYASPVTVDWPDPDHQERLYYDQFWSTTTFVMPQNVVDDLWANRQLKFWMNIDRYHPYGTYGYRVTLKSAVLTVKYFASGPAPTGRMPVYRFWSPLLSSHFYTINEAEKQYVIDTYPTTVWSYEGIAYYVLADQTDPRVVPVYRFWSPVLGGHYFTADEVDKNRLVNEYADVWTFEGIAFYAFPLDQAPPAGTLPVYRFSSESLGRYFYTINEGEKEMIIATWPDIWAFEGMAWYTYPAEQQ